MKAGQKVCWVAIFGYPKKPGKAGEETPKTIGAAAEAFLTTG
jgi:hypothetical protein